jgi:hypothetical protein
VTWRVALLIIVLFGIFTVYMLLHVTETEPVWARTTYLYSSVQAIAFAAVGWLFGREVHREQAQIAERRVGEALRELGAANAEVAKGRVLAAAVRAKAAALPQKTAPLQSLGGAVVADVAHADLTELADLATGLYR